MQVLFSIVASLSSSVYSPCQFLESEFSLIATRPYQSPPDLKSYCSSCSAQTTIVFALFAERKVYSRVSVAVKFKILSSQIVSSSS